MNNQVKKDILGIMHKALRMTKEKNAVLWGLKLDGCSVSRKEIEKAVNIEIKRG